MFQAGAPTPYTVIEDPRYLPIAGLPAAGARHLSSAETVAIGNATSARGGRLRRTRPGIYSCSHCRETFTTKHRLECKRALML